MNKKGGNFFEEHIEKVVWAIVGLVCIGLLIFRVLFSPNYVSYDNKKFGPSDIDDYISKQAERLSHSLNREPKPLEPYEPCSPGFFALVDSAFDIDAGLGPPQPPHILSSIRDNRKYRIPPIGEVNGVVVELITTVAYVPTEKITEENIYDNAKHEPNDIDFVTVSSKFDVERLAENLHECFAGVDVKEEWRDPCLAKPIFAAVQLQRQEFLADGGWSEWQSVPRTKIDHRRGLFEIIEEVDKLPPGGIEVRLLQFDESQVKRDLLQPQAYRIASAKEEWFPPSLYKKFVKVQSEITVQEKRQAREAEKKRLEAERAKREEARTRRDETRPGQWSRTTRTPATRGRSVGRGRSGEFGGVMGQLFGGMSPGRGGTATRGRSRNRNDRLSNRAPWTSSGERGTRGRDTEPLAGSREVSTTSTDDIYKELDNILITEKTNLSAMRDLVFWAHDDIVETGKSYRYRIRLGVFNPLAGTNQFSEEYKSLKNNAILWSEFSDVTETVEIPGRFYFFSRGKHEASKTVTVTVSRYTLGYWYSKDFTVKQGEAIGKESEYKITKDEEKKKVTVPKTIDYATGAVLVDVIPVSDWSGTTQMRPRHYFDMLYSFDGTNINHMSVQPRYWAEKLQAKFNEIKASERELKEPLRDWSSGRVGVRRMWTPQKDSKEFRGGDFMQQLFQDMFRNR